MSPSPSKPPRLETLFRDDRYHVVSKPPGLSTVSERWRPELPTVMRLLWAEWKKEDPDALRPHLIHRLDKDTTGVLIFACDRDAQVALRQEFRERTVDKTYLTLVAGRPDPPEGVIEFNIGEDPSKAGKMMVCEKGKACSTAYETLETFRDVTWVRCRPKTGRTHQIRVSMESIGTPCAVDPLYRRVDALYLSQWKRNYHTGRGEEERPLIGRLTLHAETLTFTHPDKGRMTVEAPLPKDLSSTLKQLRKWGAVS